MPRIHSLYYQICQCHPKLFWNHFRLEHALIVQKFNVDFRAFQSHPVRKVWSYLVISRRWYFNIFGGALCNCIFINRQRGCSEIWWPVQKINFALSLMLDVCKYVIQWIANFTLASFLSSKSSIYPRIYYIIIYSL